VCADATLQSMFCLSHQVIGEHVGVEDPHFDSIHGLDGSLIVATVAQHTIIKAVTRHRGGSVKVGRGRGAHKTSSSSHLICSGLTTFLLFVRRLLPPACGTVQCEGHTRCRQLCVHAPLLARRRTRR